jgi:AraC family transcriptional regulator
MSYLEQINRAIDYIEDHILTSVDIEQISKEAGISRWHFQRVFQATVGDTVKNYLLCRRLSIAAKSLLTTEQGILHIALSHGFESHEVFSRAFKRVFGVTPSVFREQRGSLLAIPFKPRVTLDYINYLYKGVILTPAITSLPAFSLMGRSEELKPIGEDLPGNAAVVSDLWKRIQSETESLQSLGLGERIGAISGAFVCDSDLRFEYFAGYVRRSQNAMTAGFRTLQVPAGEYAEFVHMGPMRQLSRTYDFIYGSWFSKSGRKRGNGPEFSRYPDQFNPLAEDLKISIFVPLAPS